MASHAHYLMTNPGRPYLRALWPRQIPIELDAGLAEEPLPPAIAQAPLPPYGRNSLLVQGLCAHLLDCVYDL